MSKTYQISFYFQSGKVVDTPRMDKKAYDSYVSYLVKAEQSPPSAQLITVDYPDENYILRLSHVEYYHIKTFEAVEPEKDKSLTGEDKPESSATNQKYTGPKMSKVEAVKGGDGSGEKI